MRPTPIYDELAARHREHRATVGPPEDTTSILSFPDVRPGGRPAEPLPQRRPRHLLRRG